jgi:TPR repeat protein
VARNRSSDNNVLAFPQADRIRLDRAIKAFDSGDKSHALYEEFFNLAKKGIREANYFVGCMYEDGSNGVSKNVETALQFYENSIEGFGYTEGYLAVARVLYHGEEVPQDYQRAFRYYEHVAINSGHLVACFMLGRMFQYGQGVVKDTNAARHWYGKAISAGSIYGLLNLSMLEAEQGREFKSVFLRICAGMRAFFIALKDRTDIRLRGG